ncbi:hypothetical protein [Streptomyces albireticuli]|uniref:hypothetical protein n=1 Tax=Streptomyces albireticuli TaxID=1940 RepID=UPI0036BE3C7A
MTTTRRVLTTLATAALLTVGAAALAAPAQADVHATVLGGIATVDTNGTIDVGAGGATVLSVPNVLNPVL